MSTVAGKITLGSTGTKVIGVGAALNDIMFFPEGISTVGYADHSYQFSRTDGMASDYTKALVGYDAVGNKVLEFSVTAWGAATITLNVTMANPSYPLAIVGRT